MQDQLFVLYLESRLICALTSAVIILKCNFLYVNYLLALNDKRC